MKDNGVDKVRDTAEDTVGGTAENKVGDKVREHFFWTLCNPYTPHPGNQGSPLLEPGQWPPSCGGQTSPRQGDNILPW